MRLKRKVLKYPAASSRDPNPAYIPSQEESDLAPRTKWRAIVTSRVSRDRPVRGGNAEIGNRDDNERRNYRAMRENAARTSPRLRGINHGNESGKYFTFIRPVG